MERQDTSVIRRIWRSIAFHCTWPFAILAFRLRERRYQREIVPRRWLSSGEILTQDLKSYEPKDTFALDLKFIEDFAKARDELFSQIKKQLAFSAIALVYLAATYWGTGIGLSVFGFSIKEAPGVAEALIVISNLLACYTLVLQGNAYLIETAIKHAIDRSVPEELKTIYLVRYFPHDYFGAYTPFNLPHMIPNAATRFLSKVVVLLMLILLAVSTLSFIGLSFSLTLYFLWFHPQLGKWSYALLAFILASGFSAFLYSTLTRYRLPYLDYAVNHELELLKQVDMDRYNQRLQEIYGKMNADKRSMQARGFMK